MTAKTFVIVDDTTGDTVGLFTCDADPDLALPFGGVGQHLVDDPVLVAQIQAATPASYEPPVADPFAELPPL